MQGHRVSRRVAILWFWQCIMDSGTTLRSEVVWSDATCVDVHALCDSLFLPAFALLPCIQSIRADVCILPCSPGGHG